ncbi:MAG: pyridoxal phosphate-dependent aminotransferase [Candidatus Aenigmarchaeota archaeon]|nr:pyridoxal phosphate-dependent aminotransferase [Candidatus Aenigmarchaeota archaeon]MDI6722377.1 pyridoxal phosphate-dependent aminotransferase [Candidatus Aenigmarchaeota archaeon]
MSHISERELQLPPALIEKLLKYLSEQKGIISLGPGEPDFPAPKPLVDYTKKIAGKCNHYSPPGGRKELKEAIVKKLRKENKIKCNEENIVVTSGSQEALLLAIAATHDATEQMIVPNPSFLAYIPTLEMMDAVPVLARLKEEDNFQINPDSLERLITKKTQSIIMNTPSNPTGMVMTRKILEEIADIAIEHDLYVFSDEAYEKLIYDGKHVSIGSLNGMHKHVISFFTFSKSYAMCGYRLGYCVAPKPIADAIKKMHVYTSICAPTISQMLGVKALSLQKKYMDGMAKEYKKRRDFIVKRLNEIGLATKMPGGAFYTFSSIQSYSKNSWKFALRLLKEQKVAVVPGTEFGPDGEGFIRCSYATKMPLIEKALRRMERFVRKI